MRSVIDKADLTGFSPLYMQKIVISSQKGGVAKTTTALSLGAALAESGSHILLVDLDPQAHLTMALGLKPDSVRHSIGDVLLNQASLLEVSRETAVFNLDLVPANRGLLLVEKILHGREGYEFRLKTSLGLLKKEYYDVIIFDCPPSFGPLTLNAVTASDLIIVPVTCDYFSARSLQAYERLLDMARRKTGTNVKHRLLVTMFDRRTKLSKLMLEHYQKNNAGILCNTIIPIDSKLRESPIYGQPIMNYATGSRSAQQYRALARELLTCQKVMT